MRLAVCAIPLSKIKLSAKLQKRALLLISLDLLIFSLYITSRNLTNMLFTVFIEVVFDGEISSNTSATRRVLLSSHFRRGAPVKMRRKFVAIGSSDQSALVLALRKLPPRAGIIIAVCRFYGERD